MVSIRSIWMSGFFVGLLGLCLIPLLPHLEENAGLPLFFKLRGMTEAPSNTVVVSIDMESATNLNVSTIPEEWPRFLHARLIDTLSKEGAAVIVFDIFFKEKGRTLKEDVQLAEAIRKAGNVVLVSRIDKQEETINDKNGKKRIEISREKLSPPVQTLAEQAISMAPFPLPKNKSQDVSQYWVIKPTVGDMPTLPVVAFQVYGLRVYDEFLRLFNKVVPPNMITLPKSRHEVIQQKKIYQLVLELKSFFRAHPEISEKLMTELKKAEENSLESDSAKLLEALISLYQSPESLYLNFYGPPQTVTTIPYFALIQNLNDPSYLSAQGGLKGKAVFIGKAECLQSRQKGEGVPTVFSQSNGLDISGVEIAATAFANLSNLSHIRPLEFPIDRYVVFLWGMGVGILCLLLPASLGMIALFFVCGLYMAAAQFQFNRFFIWYPLIVPVFIQGPLAFLGTSLWKHYDINRRRKIIRAALGKFIPNQEVDQLIKNKGDMKAGEKLVYGTCMLTDAENITPLSEKMDPTELKTFMDQYYEIIFKPVEDHGGYPQDVTGDAVLSVWAAESPDVSLRKNAVLAALDIDRALNRKNSGTEAVKLPTRVGLHAGLMRRGNVGAGNRYEYRVVGEVVVTSTRIEGLNKHLGTHVLASEEVLNELNDFLTRKMGDFLLVGKLNPVKIYEVLSKRDEADKEQITLCAVFVEGLGAFQRKDWQQAERRFMECTKIRPEDGPTKFYLDQCENYRKNPPPEDWSGVVRIFTK